MIYICILGYVGIPRANRGLAVSCLSIPRYGGTLRYGERGRGREGGWGEGEREEREGGSEREEGEKPIEIRFTVSQFFLYTCIRYPRN